MMTTDNGSMQYVLLQSLSAEERIRKMLEEAKNYPKPKRQESTPYKHTIQESAPPNKQNIRVRKNGNRNL